MRDDSLRWQSCGLKKLTIASTTTNGKKIQSTIKGLRWMISGYLHTAFDILVLIRDGQRVGRYMTRDGHSTCSYNIVWHEYVLIEYMGAT